MTSQRPYFPYSSVDVPQYSYPRFNQDEVCGANLYIEQIGCVDTDWVGTKLFMNVSWVEPTYERTEETLENGLSETEIIVSHSKVFYGITLTADEYAFWYLMRLMFTNVEIQFNSFSEEESESIIGRNIKLEYEKVATGVYNILLRFQVKEDDVYHGSFGFKGCCNSLYEESPHEGCTDEGDGTPADNPECTDVTFAINANGDILETEVDRTPSTYNILWSYQRDENSSWEQIGTGSSISLGLYGTYRASLNALNCGIYTDQFIYLDPCEGFDVRIRTTNSNGLVAEVNVGGATFQWQYNDGTNDQWEVLSESSNSIMPTETGNYRVIATFNEDCEDSDIMFVNVANCDYDVTIDVDGDTATAVTDAENPEYQWNFENENGQVLIGTNNSVNLTETGIYWLIVTSGSCIESRYIFHKANDDCQKIEICNWDQMPVPQTTLIACCDGCPTLSLSITCVNRTLTITGVPGNATVDWEGPAGFTGMGNPITFPQSTPSGAFTATITADGCTYTAIYNYIMPNAGTPQQGIIV